jgi:hypothetical protein
VQLPFWPRLRVRGITPRPSRGNALDRVHLALSSDFQGTHYLLCLAILTARAGAQAVINWRPRSRSPAVLAVLVILIAVFVGSASRFRVRQPKEDQSAPAAAAAARELAKLAHAGDLIVVRARVERYDSFWRTQNNVHDPRVFYLTKTRGWGIASDEVDPSVLESFRRRRARFYVRPFTGSESAAVEAWLRQHAELVATTEFGGNTPSTRLTHGFHANVFVNSLRTFLPNSPRDTMISTPR